MHHCIEGVGLALNGGHARSGTVGGLKIRLVVDEGVVEEIEVGDDARRVHLQLAIGRTALDHRVRPARDQFLRPHPAAYAITSLEHRDVVPQRDESVGAGQSGEASSDDNDAHGLSLAQR